MSDIISREAAINCLCNGKCNVEGRWCDDGDCPPVTRLKKLPIAEPEKENAQRVLNGKAGEWTSDDWQGIRDTRYKCPNCLKFVRNNEAYCHKCGQRIMFPHISFTPYVPGEKQQTIVRWDDE